VLLLSGPKHRERGRRLAARAGVPARAGTDDLRGLMAELAVLRERGGVLVACDSAPVHLAVALDLPVVALSGPQDPLRTGPYGRPDQAITRWEGLPCAPCLKRRCRYRPEPRACMTRIEPAEVIRRARELVS
jgi:ADP-heptose:LPS heptosyltransferase